MKERPILFSGEMVRAILDGRKTQTRRIFKFHPEDDGFVFNEKGWPYRSESDGEGLIDMCEIPYKCPYGKKGDRLWVRETWYCDHVFERDYDKTGRLSLYSLTEKECENEWRGKNDEHMYFKADTPSGDFQKAGYWAEPGSHWKPSIHMPRWASRINLEITNVRVERLQDISEEDAKAEGIKRQTPEHNGPMKYTINLDYGSFNQPTAKECFKGLWENINGEDSWDQNPWVWVIEFKRV